MSESSKRRWVLQGALAAIVFALTFIICGALWSVIKVEDIRLVDHLYNGVVFATWASVGSILLGFSIGVTALFSLGKDIKKNCRLIGFALTNFLIVGVLFWGGHTRMIDNEPPSLTEKVLDLIDRDSPKN